MKIMSFLPSVVRWLLALLGAYIATTSVGSYLETNGFESLSLEASSIFELLNGIVLIVLSLALKKASELGTNGKLAAVFIGPKVHNYAASITRWLITIAAGVAAGYIQTNPEQLSNSDLTNVIIVATSFIIDRVSKAIKP